MKTICLKACRFVLLILSLILVFSCNRNSENPSYDKTKTDISLSEANIAALNIYKSDKIKSIISSKYSKIQNRTGTKKILDVITVPESGVTSYYIVNYADGGWSIIAGDRRVEPIMAYSETGQIKKGDFIPEGLGIWLLNSHENMQSLKKKEKGSNKINSSGRSASTLLLPCPVEIAWSQVLDQPLPGDDCGGCQDQYSYTSVGPLLNTLWSQGCGFNSLCPSCNNPSYCNHTPTGCVATAMAQVMYYWKMQASYNWASMNLNFGTSETARLMWDAGDGNSNYFWHCDGSGNTCSFWDGYACDGGVTYQFTAKFGYSSANHGGYDFNTLKSNLNALQPVLLGAHRDENCFIGCWPIYDGHLWVCDGYQTSSSFDCSTGTGYQWNMIHMNWGWGPGYNAWVNESNWAVNVDFGDGGGIKNFNYFRHMYSNIKP
jgi:Peptidase C10 family/Spi protease inhibitor